MADDQPKGRVNDLLTVGFDQALATFREVATRVPAYKDFLIKQSIDYRKIKSQLDFHHVPKITKKNYLQQYPLKDLLLGGGLGDARVVSMSSGSTGKPFAWARGSLSIAQSADILDDLYAKNFATKRLETLCVIAYAMGTWIAGTYMYSALLELANRGHKLVVVTPGINKEEIAHIFRELGPQFDQVLIMGYPPFVKDVIEHSLEQRIDLKALNLKFMFSSEHFSEVWRDYVLNKVQKNYDASNSTNLYGAADTGIIGMESLLLQHCRRIIAKDSLLLKKLFPDSAVLPTLVDFDPTIRYVELVEGNLVITMRNSLPLVRYDIQDRGMVLSQSELVNSIEVGGYHIPAKLLSSPPKPVIALYGRVDVATMFYGVNIYPENIGKALELYIDDAVTGKFRVGTRVDSKQEQSLHIYIETKNNAVMNDRQRRTISKELQLHIRHVNTEYNKLCDVIGAKANSKVHFVKYEGEGFKNDTKHKWITS